MTVFTRTIRSGLLLAALLHALVGGWGAWLHGAPPALEAAVHAPAGGADADGAWLHGSDCALCHSASTQKLASTRATLWPAGDVRRFPDFNAEQPSALRGPLSRSGGARAPPRHV